MEPAKDTSSKNMIIGVVVVIIVLALGTYLLTRNSSTSNTEASPSPTEMTSVGGDKVSVGDQFPGSKLYLDSVTFANGGWVVVHESTNGQSGKIIGEAYFPAGTNPGSVDLGNNKLVAGNEYVVMLHSDDGDKKFDATKDLPLTDDQGNIIMKVIKASKTPEQVKG
ncbi:MAG: hypothetical protein PHV42_00190 [Candidatus Pacebacteria bacterium]|nr:hypothetical protein [Candidatus Paceibacterota bacterium]